MTNYLIAAVFAFSLNVKAQNQINFSYDAVGNQTIRELICVNCNVPSASRTGSPPTTSDFTESSELKGLRYYPNPVAEKLFLEWNRDDDGQNVIKQLQLYSQAGQLLLTKENLENLKATDVEFQSLAQGIYLIILQYSDGESKTLKIVKK